ncbi:hypothetical protein PENSPDRAFT_646975, partial [Peniophora sp. CONT]
MPINQGAAILVREHEIFRLIARGILTLSKTANNAELRSILEICASYERLGQSLVLRSSRNPLRKDYKRTLRREWYPLLQALDSLPGNPGTSRMHNCVLMREAWFKMGKLGAGFDIAKEQDEYKRRAAKLCSWRECQWHTIEPSSPPKMCQGCGEARYCSKPCQHDDWKSGGHKQVCRRLKDVPHEL